MLKLGHEVRNLSSRSFSMLRALITGGLLSLCGCIPRNPRVGKLESSRPELRPLCSLGREMRGDESRKREALPGSLVPAC